MLEFVDAYLVDAVARTNEKPSATFRYGLTLCAVCDSNDIHSAGWSGASQGIVSAQFRSHFIDISPLDGKPAERDAPRGFDRSRERSSGGQSDRRPAPKEQPPPETLRQKDRIG
jgi:hypothetical protein